METTKQLTATQKRAIEIVQKLVDEGKVNFSDAFALIAAIYENEKEFVYIPYQTPYPSIPWTTSPSTLPWWEQNEVLCSDTNSIDVNKAKPIETYLSGSSDWMTNISDFSVLSY